ncbi:uncharacterized protein BDZ99DRAFT_194527 [Mytilinidion resinicola]|uniref:Uncharacterized protein n=1 Tax=Mytilinidion resinicola TaxID=574789 RepID=A0A6A6Z596_9PEZI|nr:uncharacterized protein BDZ99DRAFT_194527 [Mytilinidion resinicola]KAF2815355.1 hypothetical protein BDZ99DRAFT_194527 [Mytilinidion resinicola]
MPLLRSDPTRRHLGGNQVTHCFQTEDPAVANGLSETKMGLYCQFLEVVFIASSWLRPIGPYGSACKVGGDLVDPIFNPMELLSRPKGIWSQPVQRHDHAWEGGKYGLARRAFQRETQISKRSKTHTSHVELGPLLCTRQHVIRSRSHRGGHEWIDRFCSLSPPPIRQWTVLRGMFASQTGESECHLCGTIAERRVYCLCYQTFGPDVIEIPLGNFGHSTYEATHWIQLSIGLACRPISTGLASCSNAESTSGKDVADGMCEDTSMIVVCGVRCGLLDSVGGKCLRKVGALFCSWVPSLRLDFFY